MANLSSGMDSLLRSEGLPKRDPREHTKQMSAYDAFAQDYPQLDEYGRKVASGRQFKETMGTLADALNNTSGQLMEGKADTGAGNIMDYLGFGAMTAFHGSPHKFDKFSMENIGTGEGAQAYGHGLYFAEDPSVAGSYQRNLSQDGAIFNG